MDEYEKLSIARWATKHKVSMALAIPAQQLVVMADGAYAMLEGLRTGNGC